MRGSRLWGRLFQRVFFKDHRAFGEPGVVNGLHYEPPPDIDAEPDAFDLVAYDCSPGSANPFPEPWNQGLRTPRCHLARSVLLSIQ